MTFFIENKANIIQFQKRICTPQIIVAMAKVKVGLVHMGCTKDVQPNINKAIKDPNWRECFSLMSGLYARVKNTRANERAGEHIKGRFLI